MNKKSRTVMTLCGMSLVLTFGPFWISQAQDLPPEVLRYADMVLYNGRVLTMDRDIPDEDLSESKVLATIIGGKVVYGSLN